MIGDFPGHWSSYSHRPRGPFIHESSRSLLNPAVRTAQENEKALEGANGGCPHTYSVCTAECFSNPHVHRAAPGDLTKNVDSDSVDLEWGLRLCISHKLPDDGLSLFICKALEHNGSFASINEDGGRPLGLAWF